MPRSRVYLRERSEVLPLLLRTDPRNVVRFASATEQSFEMMMHICEVVCVMGETVVEPPLQTI
jgi:hypothetical protein